MRSCDGSRWLHRWFDSTAAATHVGEPDSQPNGRVTVLWITLTVSNAEESPEITALMVNTHSHVTGNLPTKSNRSRLQES